MFRSFWHIFKNSLIILLLIKWVEGKTSYCFVSFTLSFLNSYNVNNDWGFLCCRWFIFFFSIMFLFIFQVSYLKLLESYGVDPDRFDSDSCSDGPSTDRRTRFVLGSTGIELATRPGWHQFDIYSAGFSWLAGSPQGEGSRFKRFCHLPALNSHSTLFIWLTGIETTQRSENPDRSRPRSLSTSVTRAGVGSTRTGTNLKFLWRAYSTNTKNGRKLLNI